MGLLLLRIEMKVGPDPTVLVERGFPGIRAWKISHLVNERG